MNMIKSACILIGLLLLAAACKNSVEKETPKGLKFTVVKAGDGVLPKKNEILVFDYVLKDSKDSVWSDSFEGGLPGYVMIQDSSALDMEDPMSQMFRMLSKGDSVRVGMSIKKFFSEIVGAPMPPQVDSALNLSYILKVHDIMSMEEFRPYQMSLMEKKQEKQKVKDAEIINKYLADHNITAAQQDPSGLQYVIHNTTGGAKPSLESCVEVKYEGKFMDNGQTLDQNERAVFSLGQVIRGWQIGIEKLGVGDSATLYIPSDLAYGAQGYPGVIPPNSILIFDVELLAIGQGVDQQTGSCK